MFELPKLPYAYDALEPYIDEETMKTHHTKHHQGYTDKLNAAIAGTERENKSIEEILKNLDDAPIDKVEAITNNGGGYYNHKLFREMMTPGGKEISAEFKALIEKYFDSFEAFKEEFTISAKGNFGSGWTWLVKDAGGHLEIMNTANQDSPISDSYTILLGIDVWEHAYYLKYQNRRPEYIQNWWNVVNWEQVEKNYNA